MEQTAKKNSVLHLPVGLSSRPLLEPRPSERLLVHLLLPPAWQPSCLPAGLVQGHAAADCQRPCCCSRVEVFCYALSPSDGSEWRQRIEREAEHFFDVSMWSVPDIAGRISADQIQVGNAVLGLPNRWRDLCDHVQVDTCL